MSAATAAATATPSESPTTSLPTSEAEWKAKLSPLEYAVLREKHTEPGDSRGYTKSKERGEFLCKACEAPLYSSDTKFDSGCGWPAFWSDNTHTHTQIATSATRKQ